METICDLCSEAIDLDESEACTECGCTTCTTCGEMVAGEDHDGGEDAWFCDDCIDALEAVASVARAEANLGGES